VDINIILIHIGSIYPNYINDCIIQLKNLNFNVHLIISENLIGYVPYNDINISKIEDYINEKYDSFSIQGYDKNFRDGFWCSTSSRFFILENYVKVKNIKNFYHIEYDNLIYDDLKHTTEILTKQKEDMFLVIDSESRCIPSIMFIKNYKILNELTNFILLNSNKNDMENLFRFYYLNRSNVGNLPILPTNNNIDLISKTGIKNSGNINYTNLFDDLNIIFDGAAFGQYVGGVDTRNDSSNTVGFVNETTIFDVSKLDISWEKKLPVITHNNKKIRICNLHIHSKTLNKFLINNNYE
jgi:hypothetical protein